MIAWLHIIPSGVLRQQTLTPTPRTSCVGFVRVWDQLHVLLLHCTPSPDVFMRVGSPQVCASFDDVRSAAGCVVCAPRRNGSLFVTRARIGALRRAPTCGATHNTH